jgi:hypothetical protein
LLLIQILKKYQLNTPIKIDDERGSFIITGIKDGKLLVTHIKKNGVTKYKSFNLEEFNNWNDFELIQYGLDVFRKSDKKKYKKKQNKARVPKEMINNSQGSVEQVEKRKNKK